MQAFIQMITDVKQPNIESIPFVLNHQNLTLLFISLDSLFMAFPFPRKSWQCLYSLIKLN